METEPKPCVEENNDINNIINNLSSLYSSISQSFTKINKYLSQYQLLRENNKKSENQINDMIDLTGNEDKPENNKISTNDDKNSLIIVLNNSANSPNATQIEKGKNDINKINKNDIKSELNEKSTEENTSNDKITNNNENKNWEINNLFRNLNMSFKDESKKVNRSEIKLPINNINNYYFKEINITNNNNIKKSRSELRRRKDENIIIKNLSNNKKEKKDSIENKNTNNIIHLKEEEEDEKNNDKKLKKTNMGDAEKTKDKKSKRGYKFKIKFLDYCYIFGYYQSYNDAYYDKIQISKYFNEIDLFSLNYNEQFSYKNISIKLKEKYPLLSVKYLKNNINYETKIKTK